MKENEANKSEFPPTAFKLVVDALDPATVVRQKAQGELFKTYWPPLFGYAVKLGNSEHDAEELLQAYFCKLISGKKLEKFDETRGKFRTFLLTSFGSFIKDEWNKGQAKKRGGGAEMFSIDKEEAGRIIDLSDSSSLTPEETYERLWAHTLLEQSLLQMRKSYIRNYKLKKFNALLLVLSPGKTDYSRLVENLGCSVETARVEAARFKKKYKQFIRAEIADTIDPGEDVEEELRNLLKAFSK